jgi:hypothetical protein
MSIPTAPMQAEAEEAEKSENPQEENRREAF